MKERAGHISCGHFNTKKVSGHVLVSRNATRPGSLLDHIIREQARTYTSRIHSADTDALTTMIDRVLLHQGKSSSLRYSIWSEMLPGIYRLVGDIEENDPATILGAEYFYRGLTTALMPIEVQIEAALEFSQRDVRDRPLRCRTGIRHENVEAAALQNDAVKRARDVTLACYVAGNRHAPQFLPQHFQSVLIYVERGNFGSGFREDPRNLTSNSIAGPSHCNHLSCQWTLGRLRWISHDRNFDTKLGIT